MRYFIKAGTPVRLPGIWYEHRVALTHRDVFYTEDDLVSYEATQAIFQFPPYTPKDWPYPVGQIIVSPKHILIC